MNPSQKIKLAILQYEAQVLNKAPLILCSGEGVDQLFAQRVPHGGRYYATEHIRNSGTPTGLPSKLNPHRARYDHVEVAAEMHDGSWVGWTHWSGGFFGLADEVEWIDEAYSVSMVEEQRTIAVQTFAKTCLEAK